MDESLIREGLVTVHRKGPDNRVLFYNPSQVFNRDLSLVVLKTFIAIERQKVESNPKLGRFVGVNILESLAATGIRGIRYLKELGELVNLVTFNDLDRNSAEMIAVNAELNGLDPRRFRVTCCDANLLSMILTPPPDVAKSFQMAGNINKIPPGSINEANTVLREFNRSVDGLLKVVSLTQAEPPGDEGPAAEYRNVVDVVDLDPYSSATGFIDAAVRCVRSGGLLLVTSTDMPTLCGNNPLVSFYKYGGASFKSPFCHELSLRVLLYSVMMTASRYKRVIHPLLSVSVDFYVRVFVRVRYSPEGCKAVAANAGVVLMCVRCHSFKIHKLCEDFVPAEPEVAAPENGAATNGEAHAHPAKAKRRKVRRAGAPSNLSKTCEECGARLKMGGPLYTGPLHDKEFVDVALETNRRIFEPPEGAPEGGDAPHHTLSGVTMGKRIRGVLTAIQEVSADTRAGGRRAALLLGHGPVPELEPLDDQPDPVQVGAGDAQEHAAQDGTPRVQLPPRPELDQDGRAEPRGDGRDQGTRKELGQAGRPRVLQARSRVSAITLAAPPESTSTSRSSAASTSRSGCLTRRATGDRRRCTGRARPQSGSNLDLLGDGVGGKQRASHPCGAR